MILYLAGCEHNYYRELLAKFRVKNVCLSFPYILRLPKVDWKEQLAPFDKVMINPGINLGIDNVWKLTNFLNDNNTLIDFCLDVPDWSDVLNGETDVPIVPIYGLTHYIDGDIIAVLKKQTEEIFFRNHLQEMKKKHKVHGVEWLNSTNYSASSSLWFQGGYRGLTFYFDGKLIKTFPKEQKSARLFLARKYKNQKLLDIDLDAIRKDDWKEVAKLNLFAWQQYIENMGD
jgi:hypothetical protein